MDTRDRDIRFLKRYAIGSTTVMLLMAATAFVRQPQKQKFTEIDVERINIVEPDGNLRMVISNRPRSIGPIYKGKPFGYPGGTRPGIIFFNDEGTENGGLTLRGQRAPDGTYQAGTHMAFDQFDQDQIVVLNYSDTNGDRQAGLSFSDRTTRPIIEFVAERDSIQKMPDGPAKTEALRRLSSPIRDGEVLAAQRVYLGRDRSKSSVLRLSDPRGRPRLIMRVDSLGAPHLEFLDDSGRVTARLPEQRR
ncbi:MAG: hypothetical protein K0S86_1269 [Geminicoccaceae bacterium]|jgi:hypothetical protein|nr:hypothetical protein [Geminicoccaceae bacterium]